MDPDQDQRSVGHDLGLNCLQRLSAADKAAASRQRVNDLIKITKKMNWIFHSNCLH